MKKLLIVSLGAIVTLLTGCGQNVSTNTYQAAETGVASKVLYGTIIAQRPVAIDTSNNKQAPVLVQWVALLLVAVRVVI